MDQLFKDSRCYRPDEIASILNIGDVSTVYRMIRNIEDPLPAFKLKKNGQIRVRGFEINKYVEDHKIDPLEE